MNHLRTVFDDAYSGGQPTVAELTALARKGVCTIINPRHPSGTAGWDEADAVAGPQRCLTAGP